MFADGGDHRFGDRGQGLVGLDLINWQHPNRKTLGRILLACALTTGWRRCVACAAIDVGENVATTAALDWAKRGGKILCRFVNGRIGTCPRDKRPDLCG